MGTVWLEALIACLVLLSAGAIFVFLKRGCRVPVDARLLVEAALAKMDELDEEEAPDEAYQDAMVVLTSGVPPWGAEMLVERLQDPENPSRRRYLEALRTADRSTVRDDLVAIARDVTDPLAPEVWSLLTGRPEAEWAKAFAASDGGNDESAFLAAPGPAA